MLKLDLITAENFHRMFDIRDIVQNSVYYPASYIDMQDIKYLSDKYASFIHADYSTPRHRIESNMRTALLEFGYELIGLRYVAKEEITPNGFHPYYIPFHPLELERLQDHIYRDRYQFRNFQPFALWAVYELNPDKAPNNKGRANRISLLHIGGEGAATLDALYRHNRTNPAAVCLINSSEGGFGDNWTYFRRPDLRFHQILQVNAREFGVPMPEYILAEMPNHPDYPFRWPDYDAGHVVSPVNPHGPHFDIYMIQRSGNR